MTRTLLLGGARSGKSAQAERLAQACGREVVYVATAQAGDAEMQVRISHHRTRRPAEWQTVEESTALGDLIERYNDPARVLLIDCLTLWLTNLLFADEKAYPEVGRIDPPPTFQRERASLLAALERARGDVILVSNEVGWGVVPQGAVSRWFVDEAGRINQDVAALCENVILVAAGLPLALKGRAC